MHHTALAKLVRTIHNLWMAFGSFYWRGYAFFFHVLCIAAWGYLTFQNGWLLGFGLGWAPAILTAAILALAWPLLAVLLPLAVPIFIYMLPPGTPYADPGQSAARLMVISALLVFFYILFGAMEFIDGTKRHPILRFAAKASAILLLIIMSGTAKQYL